MVAFADYFDPNAHHFHAREPGLRAFAGFGMSALNTREDAGRSMAKLGLAI
jgi:hypothetical protein